MPFGQKIAGPAHITALTQLVGKDHHGLRVGDLLLEDKMNFDALCQLSNPSLRELLSQKVPGSEGTIFFLEMMNQLVSSYLDKSLIH